MNEKQHLQRLRRDYRNEWDKHQIIADQNARLLQAGKQPSNEQLIMEERAAQAVERARDELLAASARLEQT